MDASLPAARLSSAKNAARLAVLVAMAFAAGCSSPDTTASLTPVEAAIVEGSQQIGAWQYEYTVSARGTRSEGYYGKLSYQGQEVPTPDSINRYYETPWGRLYWVGTPAVLWGDHGWMPRPQVREQVGLPLPNPATLAGTTFTIEMMVLTSEALGTPDRLEADSDVLEALAPFGVTEAHRQTGWMALSQEWTSLHDTKRWGHLEVSMAGRDQGPNPSLAFRSTGDVTIDTAAQANTLDSLLTMPTSPGAVKIVPLQAQPGSLQALRCTLSVLPGDDLVLYPVCRVQE